MNIRQFRYGADNFSYLIYGKRSSIAIDGGAAEKIKSFLTAQDLTLEFVANTHAHPDHTVGNQALLDGSHAEYLSPRKLLARSVIDLEGEIIRVYPTPGHTEDSVVFHWDGVLITGDTLFNGTVGNCFSGDLKAFFASIQTLLAFPGKTVVYAGHDYVKESLAFARKIEPDNPELDRFLQKYDPGHVRSTLAEEVKINPFLRFNAPRIVSVLQKRKLPHSTEFERWESLMSIE